MSHQHFLREAINANVDKGGVTSTVDGCVSSVMVGSKKYFIKRTSGDNSREYRVLSDIHPQLIGNPNFSVPRPLWYDPETNTLVEEFVEGKILIDVINRELGRLFKNTGYLKALMSSCGRGLKVLHGLSLHDPRAGSGDIVGDLIDEETRPRIETLSGRQIIDSGSRVLDRLHFVTRAVKTGVAAHLQHHDYCFNNLMLTDRLVCFDFGKARYGYVLDDVVRFLVKLEWLKAVHSARLITAMQQAFLDGYGLRLETADPLVRFYMIHWLVYDLDSMHGSGGMMKSAKEGGNRPLVDFYHRSSKHLVKLLNDSLS